MQAAIWYAIPAGSRILAPPDHTGLRIWYDTVDFRVFQPCMLDLGRSGQNHILFSHRPARRPWRRLTHSRRDLSIASEATHAASRGAERNLQISLRSSATELSAKLRCGCCTLQMPLVYAALKRRCWGVQPGDMCRNCSYFFWDTLPPRPPRVCLGRGKLALALREIALLLVFF